MPRAEISEKKKFMMIKKNLNYIRNFGTIGYDYGWSGSHSPYDNGTIIVGSQNPILGRTKDLWAIKTNEIGMVLWDKKFGGNDNEEGYDVISTADGGYLFWIYLVVWK